MQLLQGTCMCSATRKCHIKVALTPLAQANELTPRHTCMSANQALAAADLVLLLAASYTCAQSQQRSGNLVILSTRSTQTHPSVLHGGALLRLACWNACGYCESFNLSADENRLLLCVAPL